MLCDCFDRNLEVTSIEIKTKYTNELSDCLPFSSWDNYSCIVMMKAFFVRLGLHYEHCTVTYFSLNQFMIILNFLLIKWWFNYWFRIRFNFIIPEKSFNDLRQEKKKLWYDKVFRPTIRNRWKMKTIFFFFNHADCW